MKELKNRRLIGPIKDAIESGKPFLGLCLGLQLLFEKSEEAPGVKGLGDRIGFKGGRLRFGIEFRRRLGVLGHWSFSLLRKVRMSSTNPAAMPRRSTPAILSPTAPTCPTP